MAELKTKPTNASVPTFLQTLDPARRKDCQTLVKLFTKVTMAKPRMWGPSIVGFGSFRYPTGSGTSYEWLLAGFSPRKAALTLYLMGGFEGRDDLMAKLGRHSTGKSCLYIKALADVSLPVLEQLVTKSVEATRARFPKG
jgi:hypothetical protein